MNMVRLRHIMEMRRAAKQQPLLPPSQKMKNRSRSSSETMLLDKRAGYQKDVLEVHLQLKNLQTKKGTSKLIACVFSESDGGKNGPWRKSETTDTMPKVAQLNWHTAFTVEFLFEKMQFIKIELCDWLGDNKTVSLGETIFLLAEVVAGASVDREFYEIATGEMLANVKISATVRPRPQPVLLQFCAKDLTKKVDECQVYFQCYRIEDNDDRTVIYRSEPMRYSVKIQWKQFTLTTSDICDKDSRIIEIICYYRDEKNRRGIIGMFLTTYAQLQRGSTPQNVYYLTSAENKQSRKTYGLFEVTRCSEISMYSFLDYISAGVLLHFALAVDFSKPDDYPERQARNFVDDVEVAIRAIGQTFREYDGSNSYAAFGFGARIPPLYRESQEFCLNMETDPNCHGLDAVIEAFRSSFTKVQPMKSAHFAHVIYYVSKLAQQAKNRRDTALAHYYVLAIITRGGMDDLREAISALIFASKAPISIIFVGIGAGNFGELERMSQAGARLAYQGRKADRDVLQFLPLNQIRADQTAGGNWDELRTTIADRSLYQIPKQMAAWLMKNGISPDNTSKIEDLQDATGGDQDGDRIDSGALSVPLPRRRITSPSLIDDSYLEATSIDFDQMQMDEEEVGKADAMAWTKNRLECAERSSISSLPNRRLPSIPTLVDSQMVNRSPRHQQSAPKSTELFHTVTVNKPAAIAVVYDAHEPPPQSSRRRESGAR